jgi:hypothetical protein
MKMVNKFEKLTKKGGEWTFRIGKTEAKACWENILLAVIGGKNISLFLTI